MARLLSRTMGLGLVCGVLVLGGCGGSTEQAGPLTQTPEEVARPSVMAMCKTLTESRNALAPANHIGLIKRLAQFGSSAVAAVPTLEKMSKDDPDEGIRKAATEALAAIQGGGAAPATP